MTARYLCVTSGHGIIEPSLRERAMARIHNAGFTILHDRPELLLAVQPRLQVHSLGDGRGYLLGDVFPRAAHRTGGRSTCRQDLTGLDAHSLLAAYWGDFVAIVMAPASSDITVVRAPFGRLDCLHAASGKDIVITSDLTLARAMVRADLEIDPVALAQCLAYRELPSGRTAFAGLQCLRGGRSLAIKGASASETKLWSPWSDAGPRHWVADREEAREVVRTAVLESVGAATSSANKRLLLLSGGLDSSILAASIGTLGGDYACLNLVMRDGPGDEREYARAVAGRLGCELIEADWSVADIDVTRSHVAHRPAPIGRSFMQGTNRLLAQAVEQTGADLTLDGGGGDNVFCALQSVTPVVDALRYAGVSEAWRTACSIAAVAEVGVGQVVGRSASRLFRRSRVSRWRGDVRYLAASARSGVPELTDHPWFVPPQGADAGTAAHISLMAAAQGWAEQGDLTSPVRHCAPLATVPVVAACLSVPSWWWFSAGRSRAVARQSFAQRLPPAVINRQSKGHPDSYLARIYAHNRMEVRAMLLDGRLAAMGLLDGTAIEQATRSEAPMHDTTFLRLLYLAEAEAWLAAQH